MTEPHQLADLLRQAVDAGAAPPAGCDQDRADLLRLRLADRAPCKRGPAGMQTPMERVLQHPSPADNRTLGEVLLDEQTPLALLQDVKDQAKARSARQDHPVENQVAIVIYYAAIAAARAYHGERLTHWPDRDLADAFGRLSREPWVSLQLRSLLSRGCKICLAEACSGQQAADGSQPAE